MRDFAADLRESGEYVDGQALAPHLRERAGQLERAAELYADAARAAASSAERDHLIREAARVREVLRGSARGG